MFGVDIRHFGSSPAMDDPAFYPRWRVKGAFVQSKEVVDLIIGLGEDGCYAVHLASWYRGYALGYFFLEHADHFGNMRAPIDHPKDDLRRDVVRVVAYQGEGFTGKSLGNAPLEEVRMVQSRTDLGKLALKHGNALAVQLDGMEFEVPGQEVLGQHPSTGSHFQYAVIPV